MPPATLSVEALAPAFDQGLTITRPSPATSSTRNRVKAADATPPARIAPHDTADLLDSSGRVWMATRSVIEASPLACPGDMLRAEKPQWFNWFRAPALCQMPWRRAHRPHIAAGASLSVVGLAAAAEIWLGKPVIAINTATYWHALRANGRTRSRGSGGCWRSLESSVVVCVGGAQQL